MKSPLYGSLFLLFLVFPGACSAGKDLPLSRQEASYARLAAPAAEAGLAMDGGSPRNDYAGILSEFAG
jgi:hypothetical protein